MLDTLTHSATVLIIGLVFYWIGPIIVGWLMSHLFVTHYQLLLLHF
jgi:hypothetical protein